MKVRIIDWSYKGIRGVNDLEISLVNHVGVPYSTTLLMMPNGTGKTTTITLLRAVFDGQATNWSSSEVREFKPPGSLVRVGEFKATLMIDNQRFVILLRLNYEQGRAEYKTSRVGDEGGLDDGHNLVSKAKYIFTTDFVKRFIFDGEWATSILQSNKSEAEDAIRYLYQLNYISMLSQRIKNIVDHAQQKSENTSAKTEQGLNRLRTDREKVSNKLGELLELQGKLELELQVKRKRSEAIRTKVSEHIKADNNLRVEAEELESKKKKVDIDIAEKTQAILDAFRSPFLLSNAIPERLQSLSQKMQQLKLPKTMSKQFFEELSNQPFCVCGRQIEEEHRHFILEKSEDYLADDQISVVNAIKLSIRSLEYNVDIKDEVDGLQQSITERYTITSDWDRLQTKRKEAGDIELEQLEQEQRTLEIAIHDLSTTLKKLITKDKAEQTNLEYDQNIPLCREKLAEAEKRLEEATGTVNLSKKAAKTKQYLELIEKEALKKLKEKIKQNTNEKISSIIRTESIHVEKIDGHLSLKNKSGASVGQTLAIAYSFLGSMFEASSYELPFVVDSPAGALDLDVRREVSVILPNLFEQLIIFITSGERGGFADFFYRMGDKVQFLTISRALGESATCIEGRDTFQTFQDHEQEKEIS
ncbi:coiled-coil domain-containing protein [Paenibacillus cymbidii]|uniref:hypothetical protein n=1 Tax=Paenibacillus cymbidii TaxID=1639034 RepID=UPI001080074B|nr:hypothetical protein [Paenibacillus cymbidii]